jgi:hypothetical protein
VRWRAAGGDPTPVDGHGDRRVELLGRHAGQARLHLGDAAEAQPTAAGLGFDGAAQVEHQALGRV